MRYHQLFRETTATNEIKYDGGLKSTKIEQKKLLNIHVQLSVHSGNNNNDFQGYLERAKIFEIPEEMIPTLALAEGTLTESGERFLIIPVNIDIPVGEVFKVAMKVGATGCTFRGMYEYEIAA